MTNRYEINMCEGPLFGKILRFALPLMLSSILQLLFNAADIVVVSRFAADGNTALAAVGSTNSLISLLITLLAGLSVGATVSVSRLMGARDENGVTRAVHTSITVALCGGVLVGLVGFFLGGTFLSWMDTPPNVLPGATLYVKIYFFGLPAQMLFNFSAAVLRAAGDTRRPLYYLSAAGVLNVILNLVFVTVFHMDVAGVAWATVISQALSAVLVIRCLIVNGGAVKLNPAALRIHKDEFLQILRVGVPAGIQSALFGVSNVLIQSSINMLDISMAAVGATSAEGIVIAANTATNNIENFIYFSMNACSQGTVNFVGQNAGAMKMDRVRRVVFLTGGMVCVLGLVFSSIVYFCGEFLLGIYRPGETEVIAIGMVRFSYILFPYFFCGLMDVFASAMRGLGRSVLPMVVSLLGACGLRVLWIYTFFAWQPTLGMLYLSYPISWALTAAVHAICLFFTCRKIKRSLLSTE